MKIRKFLSIGLITALLLTAGCSSDSGGSTETGGGEHLYENTAEYRFPDFVNESEVPNAADAYAYAADHPEQLKHIPCYCGCGSLGHDSVRSCFIKGGKGKEAEFNDHGAHCGVCVNVVLDTMKGKQEGKSLQEVRKDIEAKYEQDMGMKPTNTPEPPKGM